MERVLTSPFCSLNQKFGESLSEPGDCRVPTDKAVRILLVSDVAFSRGICFSSSCLVLGLLAANAYGDPKICFSIFPLVCGFGGLYPIDDRILFCRYDKFPLFCTPKRSFRSYQFSCLASKCTFLV